MNQIDKVRIELDSDIDISKLDLGIWKIERKIVSKQIELRRQAIADRFAHAWNKSATRIPISVKEYRALLDLWEESKQILKISSDQESTDRLIAILEKLEKGG